MIRIILSRRAGIYAVKLSAAYGDEFDEILSFFKLSIPAYLRSYDSPSKHWHLPETEEATSYLHSFCIEAEKRGAVIVEGLTGDRFNSNGGQRKQKQEKQEKQEKPRHKSRLATAYERLYLIENAPTFMVKAARRAIAKECHPDREGGDLEQMKTINEAADQILKGRD